MPPRRKSRRWRVAGWALLLLIGLPISYFAYQSLTMPRYKGETVAYWLEQSANFTNPPMREVADEAFRALGPKAAPFLVREYRARMSHHGMRHKLMSNQKLSMFVYQNEHRLPPSFANWLTGRDQVGRWKVQGYLWELGTNLVVVERDLTGLLQAHYPAEVVEVLNLLNRIGPAGWKSVPKIARLLDHENEKVRNQAAWTIGSLVRPGDPYADDIEIAAREGRIRAAVGVRALDRMKASPVSLFPELRKQLLNPAEQIEAIDCIAGLNQGKELLIPALGEALGAKNPQFRLRVVRVLGSMPGQEAIETLAAYLADDYYYVKAEAARCLGRAGPAAQVSLPALRGLIGHQHPDVRESAAAAIASIEFQITTAAAPASVSLPAPPAEK